MTDTSAEQPFIPAEIDREIRRYDVPGPDTYGSWTPAFGQQFELSCTGCGQLIHTTLDAVQHAGCHQAGDLADGPTCGHLRPILRLAGVDLPVLSCIRAPGHEENLHRGADASEWAESIPDWWNGLNDQVGDILAALIRRGGSDVAEIADDDLKRGPDEVVRIQHDEDGCVRVEITTEVPE